VNEVYSSKTCGMCGQINSKLEGRKTFHCSHGKMRCDKMSMELLISFALLERINGNAFISHRV